MYRILFFAAACIVALLPTNASAAGKADTLNTSVVTGTRVSMLRDQVSAPVSVITRTAIASSDQNTVMPALMEQVPGFFITSRGVSGYGVSGGSAGAISLRGFGAASGRVAILIDGHPQFESIYGHPVPDEYLAGNASRVEVSRGAASVLYGSGAMGGAINILTRKPVKDGNLLSFKAMGGSYGSVRGSLYDAYKSGRFSASASLNYDRTDGHRDRSAFNSIGGMATAGYQLSDYWKTSARFSYTDATAMNPGTVSAPMLDADAHIMRGMAGVSLDNESDRTSGSIDLFYNWGNHVINDGHLVSKPAQEYLFHGTDYTAGVTAYQTVSFWKGNRLTAGVDWMQYGGHAYRNPVTEIYADHRKLHEEAAYLFDNQELGAFDLSAGLRIDHHSLCGTQLIPHAGISWRPTKLSYAKATVSKGFRVPNMRELYMYMVANESLKPEDAWSYDLTLGHHFLNGALDVEASAFYTTGANIIAVAVVDGKRQNHNVGEFANKGVELSANWKACKALSFNANYSWLDMSTIYTGAPAHKAWFGAVWTPGRFSVNLGAMAISGLYLTTGEGAKTSEYVDARLRVSYGLTDKIRLFAHGFNLLNRHFETMDGFPEPGVTVLGGFSLDL